MPRDAPFTLSGRFTAAGEAADGCRATGIVSIAGINADGFPIFVVQTFDCNDPPDQAEFFLTDSALADTTIAFTIEIEAYPEGGGSLDLLGQGAATFEFQIDFGDRDGDGLLDTWETDGIDIDGDSQLEIDLPGMGANPDVKDIFVEVDVMAGVSFDQSATDAVEYAFAQAPASAVDNYDGSSGIQLHVVVDGDRPGNVALVLAPGEDLPADYYAIKDSFFGSEQDRIHPQWSEIWDVRLKIFRYCLWADTLAYSDGGGVYGLSEAVPSNDFVLAAGQMQSAPQFANVLSDAFAGMFMHELGHTLGLLHGGGPENAPEYKPNYLSVMNYAYSEPWDKITNQGTNAKEVWRLDYSRSALRTLEEGALLETEGLDGPSGRMILFNSSADGVPSRINIAWASASEVDWNFSQVIESDPYPLDVSNLLSRAASHDTLHSFTDWDRLCYHLSGDSTSTTNRGPSRRRPRGGSMKTLFRRSSMPSGSIRPPWAI